LFTFSDKVQRTGQDMGRDWRLHIRDTIRKTDPDPLAIATIVLLCVMAAQ